MARPKLLLQSMRSFVDDVAFQAMLKPSAKLLQFIPGIQAKLLQHHLRTVVITVSISSADSEIKDKHYGAPPSEQQMQSALPSGHYPENEADGKNFALNFENDYQVDMPYRFSRQIALLDRSRRSN